MVGGDDLAPEEHIMVTEIHLAAEGITVDNHLLHSGIGGVGRLLAKGVESALVTRWLGIGDAARQSDVLLVPAVVPRGGPVGVDVPDDVDIHLYLRQFHLHVALGQVEWRLDAARGEGQEEQQSAEGSGQSNVVAEGSH